MEKIIPNGTEAEPLSCQMRCLLWQENMRQKEISSFRKVNIFQRRIAVGQIALADNLRR